jgi:hypothetical protein
MSKKHGQNLFETSFAFFHSAPEKAEIWGIKYAFDTIVRHKDELTGLGCFILIDALLNKTI